MLELAQTTQPIVVHWSPSDWTGIITIIITLLSGTLLTAIVNAVLKIIDARKNAKLEIIQAELAATKEAAAAAKESAAATNAKVEAIGNQVTENRAMVDTRLQAVQQSVINLAHNSVPIVPVKASDIIKPS